MEKDKTNALLLTDFKKVLRITKRHKDIDDYIFLHSTARSVVISMSLLVTSRA